MKRKVQTVDAVKRREHEMAMLAQSPSLPIVEYFDDPSTCSPTIAFHFRGRSAKVCIKALMDEFGWDAVQATNFYSDNHDKEACQ
jgi:hypothetical protein